MNSAPHNEQPAKLTTDQEYRAPLLHAAGNAIDLIRGPMGSGYSDTCNNWYTNYVKPNHCG
jgi:hypothetical protein